MPKPENIAGQGFHTHPERANKEGRPKGARSLSTVLREMLDEEIPVLIDGKPEKKSFKDVIIRKLVKSAQAGNIRAVQEIFDRVEGKPKQTIDQTTEISGTMIFGGINIIKPDDPKPGV